MKYRHQKYTSNGAATGSGKFNDAEAIHLVKDTPHCSMLDWQ